MYTTAPFTIAEAWKHLNVNKQMNGIKMWYVHTHTEYKKNEILPFSIT